MEALFAPLLEHPGEPATLRVLSDALLEQADPWGEAIALALDLERAAPGEAAHLQGTRRLARLEERYGPLWRTRLHGEQHAGGYHLRFFRGVPTAVGENVQELPGLLKGPVAKLRYTGAAEVLTWPRLSGLVSLTLEGRGAVGNGPKLVRLAPGLTSLTLDWQGEETLALLESAPCAPHLESLALQGREAALTPPQLERLFALKLPKLRAFALHTLNLGAPGAQRLAQLPWKLERLALTEAGLGVKGTVALAASPALATVRELSLAGNTMGPKGAEALLSSPHLAQLVSLDLSSTASGAKALAPWATTGWGCRASRACWPTPRSTAWKTCGRA